MATATKTSKQPQTTDQQPTQTQAQQPATDSAIVPGAAAAKERIAVLQAEQKRIRDELKAAKAAAADPRTRLERVIARQTADGGTKWVPVILANRVRARTDAGQPPHEAINAVLGQYRAQLEAGSWQKAQPTPAAAE